MEKENRLRSKRIFLDHITLLIITKLSFTADTTMVIFYI